MSLAGEYIDAHCTKCDRLLAHIVLFEVKGEVARVKCRTCGTEHKYRGEKPTLRKSAAVVRARSASPSKKIPTEKTASTAELQRWQALEGATTPETLIRPYSTNETYGRGSVIRHDIFGLGFVEKIISDTRLDVIFRDGLKRMAMNIKKV